MALQKNPHTVFFFMIGCPHCDHARPIWDSVKGEIPGNVLEVESNDVPAEMRSRVQGFPRFERTNEHGAIIVEVEGAPKDADDLRKKLKLGRRKKGGRTRHYRSRTRRATHRRIR
jgi:hypothetical protein